MLPKQNKLTVVLANRWETQITLVNLGEYKPTRKRTVQIMLTDEQLEMLRLRQVGTDADKPVYEEIETVWLEANQ